MTMVITARHSSFQGEKKCPYGTMLKLCPAVANVLDLCSTQITDVLWRNIPAKFAFKLLSGFRENEFFKYIYAKTLFCSQVANLDFQLKFFLEDI
jgi:hypothetical protein